MKITKFVFPLATAALLNLCPGAAAQTVVTHVMPVPSDVLQNSVLFVTLLGPPNGTVVHVRVHLEFTPAGTFTANDLLIELGAPVLPNFPDWMLIGGPDLGWGTTPGTWIADDDTHTLDGQMSTSFLGGTVWDLVIDRAPGSGHSGVTGQFQDSYYEVDYVPDDVVGVVYCTSNPNSTTETAEIYATGSEVIVDNDLTLQAHKLPTNKFGYFLMSDVQGFVPLFGGGQGNLCLSGKILRFAKDVLNTGDTGQVLLQLDLTQLPQGTTFLAGETWNFQYWYRDNNPGLTSNTSNGLAVTFQ